MDNDRQVVDMLNSGDGILQMQAVSDKGYDPNAEGRQTAETKIHKVYARLGSIVITGMENDKPVEKQITVDEAVFRSRALLEMVKTPWKYRSDLEVAKNILRMFIQAIEDAKRQLTAAGFAKGHIIK